MTSYSTIRTDILVVGAGAAGCYAALQAKEKTKNVILATKGRLGHSGCTLNIKTTASLLNYNSHKNSDNPDIAANDLYKAGCYLGDRSLIHFLIENGNVVLEELEQWGIAFKRNKQDMVHVVKYPGHSYARNFFFHPGRDIIDASYGHPPGIAIMSTLSSRLKKIGLPIYEDIMLVDIIIDKEGVKAAIFYNYLSNEYLIFETNTIVLATGSYGQIFSRTKSSIFDTGDGHAVCYRNGMSLIDMEAIQYDPIDLRLAPGIDILNKDNKTFLNEYNIVNPFTYMKEPLTQAVCLEMGSAHSHVLADFRRCFTHEACPEWLHTLQKDVLNNKNINLKNTLIKTRPLAHTTFGGIPVKQKGATEVPGLFAAGAVAGGIYGFARPKGFTSMLALVYGRYSGDEASLYFSNSRKSTNINPNVVEISIKDLEANFANSNSGNDVHILTKELEDISDRSAWYVKSEQSLEKGINELALLVNKAKEKKIRVTNNQDKRLAFEWENKALMLNLHLKSSLSRCESRGVFFRKDYPTLNEDWQKNILIKKSSTDDDVISLMKNNRTW